MSKNNFLCNIQSDAFRLRKLKSVWVGLILIFVMLLITFLAMTLISFTYKNIDTTDPDVQASAEIAQLMLEESRKSMLFGCVSTCSVELFVAIVACIFIGKDFSNGGIALLIARGGSRRNVYFSKLLSICTLVVIYSCASLIIAGILTAIGGYGSKFTSADFGMLMRNFFLQILCGISSASIFVMIAFLTRSSGSSLATTIGSYIVLSLVISILEMVTAIDGKTDWLMFMPYRQMSIASTVGSLKKTAIVAVTVMPVVYFAITTLIGYFTFEKRDVKC